MAIEEFLEEDRFHAPLIAYCIAFKGTQPFLQGKAAAIGKVLTERRNAGAWEGEAEFILGILLDVDGYRKSLAEKLAVTEIYEAPLLVWAASQIRDNEVDRAMRERLQESDAVADEMVRELVRCRNPRYRATVIQLAVDASDSEYRQESIKTYLSFFKENPGNDLRPLLIRLRDYPFSSEIRTLSKHLLGEVQEP